MNKKTVQSFNRACCTTVIKCFATTSDLLIGLDQYRHIARLTRNRTRMTEALKLFFKEIGTFNKPT